MFRKTAVHRFLIRGTVEERMHAAVQSGAEKWSGDKVTLRQLQDLFASPCEDSGNISDSCSNADNSATPFAKIISAPSTSSSDNLYSSLNNESFDTVTAKSRDTSNDASVVSQGMDTTHENDPHSSVMTSGDIDVESEVLIGVNIKHTSQM